jgi:F-type H+-transporting ATPase subunit b
MKLLWRFRHPGAIPSTFLACLLLAGVVAGQSSPPAAAASSQPQAPAAPSSQSGSPGIDEEFGKPLAQESEEAAGANRPEAEKTGENSQEKMVQELKYSPSVRWMAGKLHLSSEAGYWVGIVFDFAVLAALIVFALKKNLPAMFRSRTKSIQRGLEEARKASEEANQRLAGIETRLARLDAEVATMRTAAEQETLAEEDRIRVRTEQDTRRIVYGAEAEIAAAAKLARHELKAFAADLAVGLAERRVRVDLATDQQLVQGFANQLGQVATAGNGGGKDRN